MRPISFFLLLLFFSSLAVAQVDVPKEGVSIKAEDSTLKVDKSKSFKISPVKGLSNKKVAKPSINYTPLNDRFKKKSGIDMMAKSTLLKPTWNVKQKFKEDNKDTSKFGKDYNLGDLKTTSKTLYIECRDHEYVDGDRIKLMVNDAVIHPNLTLTGQFYKVDVDLEEGFNTIYFIALNEGSSSPNTAQLRVYDENGKLLTSKRWLLTTGYKASLVVLKQ